MLNDSNEKKATLAQETQKHYTQKWEYFTVTDSTFKQEWVKLGRDEDWDLFHTSCYPYKNLKPMP